MNKDETLEAIQKARLSHETQMAKIKSVINGDEVKDPTAVLKTECEFGKWLYDDNNHVQKILGSQFYNNIETLHSRWHTEYTKIFNIFFKNRKKSFFSKIMGTDKVDEMELDKAKLYYSELLETTNDLLKALDTSQRRIQALGDSKFT
jgi:hypothetical protein